MKKDNSQIMSESEAGIFCNANENERLRRDVFRSDIDKLKLFTKMLRTNATLKKAKVIHK